MRQDERKSYYHDKSVMRVLSEKGNNELGQREKDLEPKVGRNFNVTFAQPEP